MYYFIHNSEDGLRVTEFDTKEAAEEYLLDIAGPDIDPRYRPYFIDRAPDAYDDPEKYLLIEGEPVFPKAVVTVTEYTL